MSTMTNVTDVKVGDKIKPLNVPGVNDIAALGIGVVTDINTFTSLPFIWADFDGSSQNKVNLIVHGWELVECADATPAEQQSNELSRAEQRIKELEDTTTSQVLRINHLVRALEIVNERLNKEADDRGWCNEFNEILDEVNERIASEAGACFTLEGNERDFEFIVQGTSTVHWSSTVQVTARNEDDARRFLEDSIHEYVNTDEAAQEEIRFNGFSDEDITDIDLV
jgi:TolA-binding protein